MSSAGAALFVSILTRSGEVETVYPTGGLTLGRDLACDVSAELPNLPESYTFIKKSGAGHTLRLLKGIPGVLRRRKKEVHLDALVEMDLVEKKGGFYLVELSPGTSGELSLGDTLVRFGYTRREPLPTKFPFVSTRDRVFLLLLLLSLSTHAYFVNHLNSIEISKAPPIEAIKAMPKRFARLILMPHQIRTEKKTVLKVTKADEKPPEKKVKKEERKKTPAREEKVKVAKKSGAAGREGVRERVGRKGILGVIGAREGMLSRLGSEDVWRDVDSIISGARKVDEDVREGLGGLEEVDVADLTGEFVTDRGKPRSAEDIVRDKRKSASFKETGGRGGEPDKSRIIREEADVYKVVKSYVGGLKYLYNNALRDEASLKGTITVAFVIDAFGTVTDIRMEGSTLLYSPLENSILKRIRLWRFKRLRGAEDFTISYTFDFAPVG
ncbi:MAG: AgmX/PglI C-terminal domain-containing protein [Thermodesulfobacteriota bacterium]